MSISNLLSMLHRAPARENDPEFVRRWRQPGEPIRESAMATAFRSLPGIGALQAVERALEAARGMHWHLAFLSTTGVTCSVIGDEFERVQDALMLPNGTSGQWVVEFFREPYASVSAERRRRWYRIRSVVVTALGTTTLPDGEIEQLETWKPMALDCVHKLDAARQRAIESVHTRFDHISVSPEVAANGTCRWEFTFHRSLPERDRSSQEIVGKVTVESDGKEIHTW